MRLQRRLLLAAWLPAGALLAACGARASSTVAEAVRLPKFADRNVRVRTAYLFAISDGAVLDALPCYCGCVDLTHASLHRCFVDDAGSFESHAAGCDVCVAEALDARRLLGEGRSLPEIRRHVDASYGSGGKGTNTPLPTA